MRRVCNVTMFIGEDLARFFKRYIRQQIQVWETVGPPSAALPRCLSSFESIEKADPKLHDWNIFCDILREKTPWWMKAMVVSHPENGKDKKHTL